MTYPWFAKLKTAYSRTSLCTALFALGLFVVGLAVPASTPAHAAVGINSSVNFQGRLLNAAGAVVADGRYNMQFKVYQDGTGTAPGNAGGTLMWTESWVYGVNTPDNRVTVKNGYFSVPLGSICAFTATACTANTGNAQTNTVVDFNQDTLWLSMNTGNTTTAATFATASGDGEMVPMRRLGSSVYSLNSGKLGGLTAAQFIQNVSPATTQQTANINILSGAATTVAAAKIQAVASATAPVLLLMGGATPGAGGDLLQLQNSSGTIVTKINSAGDISASGNIAAIGGRITSASILAKPAADSLSTPILIVQTSLGNNVFTIGSSAVLNQVGIGLGTTAVPSLTSSGLQIKGAIRLDGTCLQDCDTFITPLATSIQTKINIPLYDPGAFNQLIALGLPAAADNNSRILSLFDARSGVHQPSIGVFTPDENNLIGFSWDGSNTNGYVKTTGGNIILRSGTADLLTAMSNGSINIGGPLNVGVATDINANGIFVQNAPSTVMATAILKQSTSQTASLLQFQNSSAIVLASFDAGGNLAFGEDANHTISALNRTTNAGGRILTIQGSNAGIGATGQAGGDIVLKAGNAAGTSGAANGGNLYLSGGGAINGGTGGQVIVKNSFDYSSAFQVQNAASSPLLTVDATANGLVVNQGSLTIKGIANPTGITLSTSATGGSIAAGTYRYLVAGISSAGETQAISSSPVSIITTGATSVNTLSWSAVANANTIALYRSVDGGTTWFVNYVGGGVTSIADNGTTFTWATSPPAGRPNLFTNITGFLKLADGNQLSFDTAVNASAKYDSSSKSLVIGNYVSGGGALVQSDSFSIQDTTGYNNNLTISNTGAATFKNRVNSTTAFQIQNAAGTNQINVDTVNTRLGIGTVTPGSALDIRLPGNGTGIMAFFGNITSGSYGHVASRGTDSAFELAGEAGDPLTLSANGNTDNILIKNDGSVISKNTVNSTTGFQIQNAAGSSTVLDADTTNTRIGIGTNAPAATLHVAGTGLIQSATNTAGAFQVQNAGGSNIFSVDTSSGNVRIGTSTISTTPTLLLLNNSSVAAASESATTCSTSVNQGSLYYSTATNSIRSCINGAYEDVVTTSGLGIIAFGIVPDGPATSGVGDLAGVAGYNTGPCKAFMGASANVVAWNSCQAYSQGRKMTINAGTATVSASTSVYQNLCVNSLGAQPTLIGTANANDGLTAMPTFSSNATALCIATVKTGTSTNTINAIYDTRVYTTNVKIPITIAANASLGSVLKNNGTQGQFAAIAATTDLAVGVLAAYSGTTSTTSINAIMVVEGPVAIKAFSGAAGQALQSTGSAGGYATSTASPAGTLYSTFGIALSNYSASVTSCAINTACASSIFTTLNIR